MRGRHGAGAKHIELWRLSILQPFRPKLEHFRAFDMKRYRRQEPVIFFVVVGSEMNDLLVILRRLFTDSSENNKLAADSEDKEKSF